VWSRAAVPVAVALALFAAFGALGVLGALRLAHHVVRASFGAGALAVLFALPALLLALALALALAQPLSGWALDGIVREQRRDRGLPELSEEASRGAIVSSFAAALGALALGVPIFAVLTVVAWVAPPAALVTVPLKIVVGALLVAWDLLDYPLALRGFPVRERLRFCAQNFCAILGFGLTATLFFAVPGIGLLALPCGVAGAARLVD
jgi:CysZ protein